MAFISAASSSTLFALATVISALWRYARIKNFFENLFSMSNLSDLHELSLSLNTALYQHNKFQLKLCLEELLTNDGIEKQLKIVNAEAWPRASPEARAQHEFNSAMWSLLYALVKNEIENSKAIIRALLPRVPGLKLLTFNYGTITEHHGSAFDEQIQEELSSIAQDEASNRNAMHYNNLFITYPDLLEFAQKNLCLFREGLERIAQHWSIGWRVAAAEAISSVDPDAPLYLQHLAAVKHADFSHDFFSTPQCLDIMSLWIQEQASFGQQRENSIQKHQAQLTKIAKATGDKNVQHWLDSKYQFSSWSSLDITLENGWEFSFVRKPYCEQMSLSIPGGEQARDVIVPTYPEQQGWLRSLQSKIQLAEHWEINYHIYSEHDLQALLQEIRQFKVAHWQETLAD
ncbi:hypothetical protein ACNKU7_11480 [Microbulbifer sp. SA54]|uniref:hypothetical protein n=1 Tax=Microbulbifer sp. SA54 TaxID=3401577 RepID=UPI003AB06D81